MAVGPFSRECKIFDGHVDVITLLADRKKRSEREEERGEEKWKKGEAKRKEYFIRDEIHRGVITHGVPRLAARGVTLKEFAV